MPHFISAACQGESCTVCLAEGFSVQATHKVGEEIPHDDPQPRRHNLTVYVCCRCFTRLFRAVARCPGV